MVAGCAAVSPAPASAEEAWWAAPQHRAAALRRAVEDLAAAFPAQYAKAPEFLQRLDALDKRIAAAQGDDLKAAADELTALQREALLANPLLDFDRLLLVRRAEGGMGLPQNWQGNCSLPRAGFDNEIAVLSPVNPDGALATLYKPEKDVMVADVDLHFDGGKMLFSMIGSHNRWQIWEINADGSGLRQVTSGEYPDVDNYDPCYLPNGQIVFGSTGV
ncbi:MAG TPA: hypothetical protein PKV69_08405, partial [Candidatus Hydrogenedentes bacterium]|nr:hypothetical protein [Candidatus Hydrogenedentota bacterium]